MITIVDYGMGNLGSIQNMLKKIGAPAVIASDPEQVASAEKLILPGVGAFDNGMQNLSVRGLRPVLEERVIEKKIPILGICLGMQLMSESSEEGNLSGLSWIDAVTRKFRFDDPSMKVPHMGWNSVDIKSTDCLFNDMFADHRFYFVHSYFVTCRTESDVLATTCYGHDFVSSFRKENILGVQFHPEKSHKFGMKLLQNFVERV
jgi:glutamine amidotransferase